jgi:hypothetical protein
MTRNNRTIEIIDEAAMLQSIYERDKGISTLEPKGEIQPVIEPPVNTSEPEGQNKITGKVKEIKKPASVRDNNSDYGRRFLQRNELKARSCVYISQKVHLTISEIVRVISEKNITVGGYIDSILMEHLETHRDVITELYNSKLEKKKERNIMEF